MDHQREERLMKVNEMTRAIASLGRNFFRHKDNIARMEIDERGRAWWIDEYTQKRIYTHYRYLWKNFSHGGTMMDLVKHFRDYVLKDTKLPPHVFGPWPEWMCRGDLWGYGNDAMASIRDKAVFFEMINQYPACLGEGE